MKQTLAALWFDQDGATAVEYGLIVAAIAGLVLLAVFAFGGKLHAAFDRVEDRMP
jgi:pilus assembly protein Flp/PilA